MTRKWCRIHGIGEKNCFGHTTDREIVLVSKKFFGMEDLKRGDIVEYYAAPFTPSKDGPPFRIDVYAHNPVLIARYFRSPVPVARPGEGTEPSACEWRARKESEADQFSAAMQ